MSSAEPLSILVVDDSEFFTSLLADKLESNYAMTVTSATDTDGAMSILGDEPVDCVVSDYEMPETSGLELYERVDRQYDVPFILLTARGDEKVASRAIRIGIDEYLLKKSVSEDEPLEILVNRIRTVVEQRRTQRKYEQLIDNSPDEISQVSVDGEILAANEAMAVAFSVPRSELVGRRLSVFLPDKVADRRREKGEQALTAGSAVTFQDSVGVRHFHNIAVPLTTAGEGNSFQLVTREITLQKRTERKLERKSEKLALINRIVRHDINNDVQLLMAWSARLQDRVDEPEAELVGRIRDTSDHIAELTTIARDFVESFVEDTEVELELVDLGRILQSEVDKVRSTFEDARILTDDLRDVTVLANELLASVFGNLLSNAVRHNDAAQPEVEVRLTQTETDVVVRVVDNGPGVPDDRKDDVFGKGDLGPDSPGTGVGLYLVRTLVDQYDGDVWVEDAESGGAAFVVQLPEPPSRVSATD